MLYEYNLLIENKYKINLNDKLGEGAFGLIFKGLNTNTNKNVAIKIEDKSKSLLINEAKIYNLLKKIKGIPNFRSYGNVGKFNYMVIDYVGITLEHYRINNSGRLSVDKVKNIGLQMIEIIEEIHMNYIIHRDIKPENFLIYNDKIFIIDFGLSKIYIKNNKHILKRNIQNIIGNIRYCSVNIHNNISPSRRDDIESIIYILIYLLNGELPWQKIIIGNNVEKIDNIRDIKKNINNKINNTKDNIINYLLLLLNYVRKLKYDEKPNYSYIKKIIN
jgi:serine/threonine protein kinase